MSRIQAMFISMVSAFVFANGLFAEEVRNPLGEKADFQLDRDKARTTSLITKGSVNSVVDKYFPDHERGPSYNVRISYDLTVRFSGRKQGVINMLFPDEYFTPLFMEDLRKNGSYVSPDYHIKWEGRANVKTLDGGVYPQTDIIYITDIVLPSRFEEELAQIVWDANGPENVFESDRYRAIEDIKMRAYIFPGIPALGAVKVDIAGKTSGVNAKAGFDYLR
ncbi:MAG: hypothetical protein NT027_13720 [Proteobacteria bacterium]|nr:hypothetical protein [Pseudomonadota bacterium]